jgi:methyl-accepting chemotaxis protein
MMASNNEGSKENGKEQKVSWFSSMKVKILVLILISALATIIINLTVTLPMINKQVETQASDSIGALSKAYGLLVEDLLEKNNGVLAYEQYNELLEGVRIMDYNSSYAYVVDSVGTMLYHPTADKVGNKVENEVISGVVAKLTQGTVPEPKSVTYNFKGVDKYAGYFITEKEHIIVVVTADKAEVFTEYDNMTNTLVKVNLIVGIFMLIISWVVSSVMVRPMRRLRDLMNRMAELNLVHDDDLSVLLKRKDEYGVVSRATKKMKNSVREVVAQIASTSENLSKNADQLKFYAKEVSENSTDNSATSEELAASMQETTATAESIDSSISQIENNTSEVNRLTNAGKNMAEDIISRATSLKETTQRANDTAKRMYVEVKEQTNIAIEQAKAVEKVNSLTKAIMDIASQTSLLSLNASIEAARAGESGRGFAVVASEIGSLATQSTTTVSNITAIVQEVHQAVNNMADCLEKTLVYLDNTVTKDYSNFIQVSNQYSEDATKVNDTMVVIDNAINQLQINVSDIAEAINGISHTINEAATGVTDIAQKTSNTVETTLKTSEKVEESVGFSKELKDIVNKFEI